MAHAIPITAPIAESDMRRFWAKVALPDANDCLIWTAAVCKGGYGRLACGGRALKAHRFAYTALVGPIPDGLDLDHLCRVRSCVAPDHLEPVTHAENVRRGDAGSHWAARTHCPQGHPYSGDNLRVNADGSRACRACVRAWRGWKGGTLHAVKTHCPQGHPYDEANTYTTPAGARLCRACRAARRPARKAVSA